MGTEAKDYFATSASENQTLTPEAARITSHEEKKLEMEYGSSDSEGLQEQLEVMFDKHETQRRRASLATDDQPLPTRPSQKRQKTACFVHSLLESKVKSGAWAPNEEGFAQAHPSSKEHPTSENGVASNAPHTQSRLLTKKQLSDMAVGIREMSKKLGHIRLKLRVRNVFLLTKAHDQTLIAKTRDMAEWLLRHKNPDGEHYTVYVENTMQHNRIFDAEGIVAKDPTYKDRLKYWTNELCARKVRVLSTTLL